MTVLTGIRTAIDKCLSWLCVAVFMLMVAVGTYQIVVRYLFNSPSTVSEELLTYAFTWMALLSSALVFGKREHMRMGFLADKLHGMKKKILEIAIQLLILGFVSIVMIYGGTRIVQLTMSQNTASLGVPMGIVYLAVLFSGIITAVYTILNLIELWICKDGADGSFAEMQLKDKQLSGEEIAKSQAVIKETEEQ